MSAPFAQVEEVDVELFGGAGGTAEGLRRAGIDAVGYEKWPLACETRRANGHRTIEADLERYDWTGHPPVRLMWASPPCQPWSAAGDQEGEFDDRDGIPWWLRAVREVRPRIIVMENVKGLTFTKHSGYLTDMLRALRVIGYRVEWRVLDAADYGVPQNRERFILIGRCDGGPLVWPTVTHTEGGGLFTAPWVTMAAALGWGMSDRPYPTVAPGTKSGGADPSMVGGSGARRILRTGNNSRTTWVEREGEDWRDRSAPYERDVDRPAPTVDTKAPTAWEVVTLHTNRGQDEDGNRQTIDPSERPAPALTAKALGQWQLVTDQTSGYVDEDGVRSRRIARGLDEPANTIDTGAVRNWCWERPATTVQGDPRIWPPGHKVNEADVAAGRASRYRKRDGADAVRVEVWEAAVLQGFPADYVFCGNRTDQATQVGNAVPPPLAEAIVRALVKP